jgi:perosamine synthetase
MIEWWKPKFGTIELTNVSKVFENGYINEGPVTLTLETKISHFLGVKHAIFCNNGTSSIFLALKASGIGLGDFVAVPNVTFIATANAINLTGATPVLIDVYQDTLGIDMEHLMSMHEMYRFKAVVPVHVSGRSSLGRLNRDLLKFNNIRIIEDAAEAFASKNPRTGEYLGTESDAGAFSFSANKIITSGQGGLVVTNDDVIADSIRKLKDQGRGKRGTGGDDIHPVVGYNFKFTDLQAAVLDGQFDQLSQRKNHLIEVYKFYLQNIKKDTNSYLLNFDIANEEFPLWPEFRAKNVEKLTNILDKEEISYRKFWLPLHTQDAYSPGQVKPRLKTLTRDLIWLPSNYELTENQLNKICSAVNHYIESDSES